VRCAVLPSACALLLLGCARIEPPRGGPEDRTPPRLAATEPDSFAIVAPFDDPVVFSFEERISEQGVVEAVSVSPRTSPVEVDGTRTGIRVSLREGWEAGRIYQVRVEPTVRDLFGNPLEGPLELIFSTGPPIPDTRIAGTVADRVTGNAEAGARIEAIRTTDSLVYAATSDSTGAWRLRAIPAGEYRIRAYTDANRNRELDAFEPRDSARATVRDEAAGPIPLALLLPDSTPPSPVEARGVQDGVEVTFDDFLDPVQDLGPTHVRIIGPGGAGVAVVSVRTGTPPSALPPARDTAAGDTVSADAVPGDTALVDAPVADTAAAPPAAPATPTRTLRVGTERPLAPETVYRIVVTGIRNLNGVVGGGDVELTTAAAVAPASPSPTPGE
jgi:hypothetical protein